MQSYNLLLNPGQPFTSLQARGDLFVYESGSAGSDTAERRIVIKPDADAEIILRPGQRFRLAPGEKASAWAIRTLDPTVTLTGSVIIGSGEFDDANTLNTFKLDGTFTNTVSVNNDAAHAVPVALQGLTAGRLPVALDTTATQQVSIVGTVTVAGSTVNYTNAWADGSIPLASQLNVLTVVAPASNPNGLYVELAEISGYYTGTATVAPISLVAKSSAPVSQYDGDVLMITTLGPLAGGAGAAPVVNDRLPYRIKVAAGKGLYITVGSAGGVWSSCNKTVLTTIM